MARAGNKWKRRAVIEDAPIFPALICTLRHSQERKPLQTREAGLQTSEVQICREEGKPPGKGLLVNNCMGEGMCRMLKFHLSKYCFHGVSDLTLLN